MLNRTRIVFGVPAGFFNLEFARRDLKMLKMFFMSMISTSGPSLLQKSDMCKRNQKLKEHSLSLKNSLVVNECDHSDRGSLF